MNYRIILKTFDFREILCHNNGIDTGNVTDDDIKKLYHFTRVPYT